MCTNVQFVVEHQPVKRFPTQVSRLLMMLPLVIVLAISASTLAHPMPQQAQTTGEDNNGGLDPGKCTLPQYYEMWDRVFACEKAQDNEYLNDLLLSLDYTKPELRRALCAATWAKVK